MRHFDYSFLENGLLPATLVNMTNAISELKALDAQRKQDYPDIFTGLERIAKVQSVKGSNEIEGIVTSEERIREIVTKSSAPLNHDEMKIAGYRDALNAVHESFSALDARETDILGLHRLMLSYTPEGGGSYKTADNVIMEIDASGRRKVRFAPVPATETREAMEQLILAFMDARSNYNVNQLLLVPCFILDFLCIHPFSDGNGRMSRLLSLLLLYKSGFDAGKYISYEEQINKYKGQYYEALRLSSEGWHTPENSYFPFMENFVGMLLTCYRELDKRFAVVQGKHVTKKQRVEATVLNSLLPISKAEICYVLPDVSPTTVEAVLGSMVRNGAVNKVGQYKSTKYIRA
ncbi:MAG: Fic family protein [Oscillospiraceae bacterium]|jgi:Fic family protein|nr:Fic family protein [Oscillospiraceae bacterium]